VRTFLGIGLGPIQTGIFLDGAYRGGFDRIVIAEVDEELIRSVRASDGAIQISVAARDTVTTRTISGIEIYSPTDSDGVTRLIHAAAEADEVATALPSIAYFRHLRWLQKGFVQQPERQRFVYAAENHNHAAEELENAVGSFPHTHYLNTVVRQDELCPSGTRVQAPGSTHADANFGSRTSGGGIQPDSHPVM
jgi:hypothetical protein